MEREIDRTEWSASLAVPKSRAAVHYGRFLADHQN
jgi:hypothetical protein